MICWSTSTGLGAASGDQHEYPSRKRAMSQRPHCWGRFPYWPSPVYGRRLWKPSPSSLIRVPGDTIPISKGRTDAPADPTRLRSRWLWLGLAPGRVQCLPGFRPGSPGRGVRRAADSRRLHSSISKRTAVPLRGATPPGPLSASRHRRAQRNATWHAAPAKSPSSRSKYRAGPAWAKTTRCASKTPMGGGMSVKWRVK